jgi:hypothetical protein
LLNHRTLTATGLAVAATTASFAGIATANAASKTVAGGNSTITFTAKFAKAAAAHGLTLKPTGRASLKGTTLKLPIASGKFNSPTDFSVNYAGGVTLKDNGAKVTITKLEVNSATETVTAVIDGSSRVKLFKVGSPNSGNGGVNFVSFGGYSVTLTKGAAKTIDSDLSTGVLAKNKAIGTGTTKVTFKS